MTDLNFKVIGQKIKERRTSLGITQDYVANILDVNPSHVSNIECGRANPSLTALVKIANILQCSVDYFLCEEYTYKIDKSRVSSLNTEIIEKYYSKLFLDLIHSIGNFHRSRCASLYRYVMASAGAAGRASRCGQSPRRFRR